jgi:hypothetical protein
MEIKSKLMLGVILGFTAASAAQSQDYPHITVIVRHTAEISTVLLSDAEKPAARIFEKAGISVRWLNCLQRDGAFEDPACDEPLAPSHLVIHMLPRAHKAANPVFGVSFIDAGGGVYADIFMDRIQSLHQQSPRISFTQLLGAVMAHELGHLLLGEHSHSSEGLMQAHWSSEQLKKLGMGNLLFDARAAAQLRSRAATLDARNSAPILASAGN